MARITHFIQREPHDGQPVSQPTEAYLGYDEKNLYVVFVCHDDPAKVRAHETRREDFDGDDETSRLASLLETEGLPRRRNARADDGRHRMRAVDHPQP